VLDGEELFVSDWGIASKSMLMRFTRGANLQRMGMEIDNPDGTYVQSFLLGMFWPYDENAILLGEHVYQLEPAQAKEIDPAEALTIDQRIAIAEPYLTRYQL
jgi:hypothetical protein